MDAWIYRNSFAGGALRCLLASFKRSGVAMLIVGLMLTALLADAQAGIYVGIWPVNDKIDSVMAVIDQYNFDNNSTMIDPTELFKKTDDNAGDLFNATNDNNGFSFFEDDDMLTPIISQQTLTDSDKAYFSYDGPENLLFYSVKAANEFSLYTAMSGLNLIDRVGSTHDISHVSFWLGPTGVDAFGAPIPEPASVGLFIATILLGLLARRRRRRIA